VIDNNIKPAVSMLDTTIPVQRQWRITENAIRSITVVAGRVMKGRPDGVRWLVVIMGLSKTQTRTSVGGPQSSESED
jgi:hypothetical protein